MGLAAWRVQLAPDPALLAPLTEPPRYHKIQKNSSRTNRCGLQRAQRADVAQLNETGSTPHRLGQDTRAESRARFHSSRDGQEGMASFRCSMPRMIGLPLYDPQSPAFLGTSSLSRKSTQSPAFGRLRQDVADRVIAEGLGTGVGFAVAGGQTVRHEEFCALST